MKTPKIFFLLFISTLLSSCSFYTPGYINVPKYEQVGDVNAGAQIGTTADFNVSTNPIEHLSIIGNLSYAGDVSNEDDPFNTIDENEFTYTRYQAELGIGYYYKVNSNVQHDFHIGYGFGKAANFVNGTASGDEAFTSDLYNIFFQSSLIFEFSGSNVDAYFTGRYNNVTFYDFEFSLIDQPFNSRVTPDIGKRTYNVGQFGMGLITSLDFAEINMQAQFSVSDANSIDNFGVRPLGFSVGLNVNIDKAFRSAD